MGILNDLGILTIYLMYKAGIVSCVLGFTSFFLSILSAIVASSLEESPISIYKAKEFKQWSVRFFIAAVVSFCAFAMLPSFEELKMATAYAVAKKVSNSDEASRMYDAVLKLIERKIDGNGK